MFSNNEGSLDRDIRIVLGAVFAILAIFYTQGIFVVIAAVLSLVMFVTAAVGFCPIYALFGINTCKLNRS
ncbi:MAG: DUF2892 domain-containing protein [Roseiflexaceae bacterium]